MLAEPRHAASSRRPRRLRTNVFVIGVVLGSGRRRRHGPRLPAGGRLHLASSHSAGGRLSGRRGLVEGRALDLNEGYNRDSWAGVQPCRAHCRKPRVRGSAPCVVSALSALLVIGVVLAALCFA